MDKPYCGCTIKKEIYLFLWLVFGNARTYSDFVNFFGEKNLSHIVIFVNTKTCINCDALMVESMFANAIDSMASLNRGSYNSKLMILCSNVIDVIASVTSLENGECPGCQVFHVT